MTKNPQYRWALIGTDSLRGKELMRVLGRLKFPLKSLEFFDSDVAEEYSKLTEFQGEPKVIHHPSRELMDGQDLVFLASDAATNRKYGRLASELKFQALDLAETFNADEDVPVVVAGVNDEAARKLDAGLIANPNPVTIFLSHLFHPLRREFGIRKAVSFVLQPASAFEEQGIQEIMDESCALLAGSSVTRKVFRDQVAFNLLARTGKAGKDGFSTREKRIRTEIHRVLGEPVFPFSLSVIQAPVFHAYSVMTYLELDGKADIAGLERLLGGCGVFNLSSGESAGRVSPVTVAGKEEIFIGPIKQDTRIPGSFWIWTVADNLTAGSALNAAGIARTLFGIR